ncbi:hypothetical protein ACEF17_12635 [Streptococcus hyovaginalis]
MCVGESRSGEEWIDFTNTRKERVTIYEDGYGEFPDNAKNVSVWELAA